MKKVIIIGCAGSGKSTFARALAKKTGLPLVHLDLLYWQADGTTVPKDVFLARLRDHLKREEWIIDGNYSSTMEERIAACDTVFFLDYPTEVCLNGVSARRGKPREDMPCVLSDDGEDFIEFIKSYRDKNRPKVLKLIKRHKNKRILIFKTREESERFLDNLKSLCQ